MFPKTDILSKESTEDRLEEANLKIKYLHEDTQFGNPEAILGLIQDLEELVEFLRNRLFMMKPYAKVIDFDEYRIRKGLITTQTQPEMEPVKENAIHIRLVESSGE